MKELFGQPYDTSDPRRVIKAYFDRMYCDGNFVRAIELLVKRWGYSTDGAYCRFPDATSPLEEDHFNGVEVSWGDPLEDNNFIRFEEVVFFDILRLSCKIYLKKNPDQKKKIKDILDNI